jgi:MFS family permease
MASADAAADDPDDRETAGLLEQQHDAAHNDDSSSSAEPQHSGASQAAYLTLCCATNAGLYFQFHAVPSCATLLRREFDLSATQIGTLQSMYSLPTIWVILFSGLLVDHCGLWTSCLLFACVVLLSSIVWCAALQAEPASMFAMGILAQGLLGAGGESLFVAQKALLGASFGTPSHAKAAAAGGGGRGLPLSEVAAGSGSKGQPGCCEVRQGLAFGMSQVGHSSLFFALCSCV